MGRSTSDRKTKVASTSDVKDKKKSVARDESEEEESSEETSASSTKDSKSASRKRKPDSDKNEDSKKKLKSGANSSKSKSEATTEEEEPKGTIEITKTQGMFAQRGKFFIHMKQKSSEDPAVIYDVHFPVEQIDDIVEGLKALQKDCSNESELKLNAVLNGISTEHVKLTVQYDASAECFAVFLDSLKQRFKKKVTISFPVREIDDYISKIEVLKS